MKIPFDEEFDRRGTHSVKWEFVQGDDELLNLEHTDRFFGSDRVLPMWVADMDFRCPEPVVEAIKARAEHGIFGYTAPTSDFYQSVVSWMDRRNDWKIDPDWISLTPGIVPALNMLVRAFTMPGDKVLIQPPVYYPFNAAIENNNSQLVINPLMLEDGRYRMDFADLESKCSDPGVKMAILCSPHNPVGRVWTREELDNFGRICVENNVLIVSDEIHGDLIYFFNSDWFDDLSFIIGHHPDDARQLHSIPKEPSPQKKPYRNLARITYNAIPRSIKPPPPDH